MPGNDPIRPRGGGFWRFWSPRERSTEPIHTPRIDRFDKSSELRRMGVIQEGNTSAIQRVLPERCVSKETAVRVPGRVLWFDAELARKLGFDVPPNNELTMKLEEAILERFSYRILSEGEALGDREAITVIADRYGGTGTTAAGSGRAAFLPWLNACLKGIGVTALGKVDPYGRERVSDFQHAHGHISTRDVAAEAVWGIVGDNLFEMGSSRVLAMIDIGEHTLWPDGSTEHSVLEVRVGNQLRPAHVLFDRERGGEHSLETFRAMAKECGLLVEKKLGYFSLDETMKKVLAQHALTAAEQFSFRVLHGAISTSNMELGGGQIDLTTMTAQDRTAPIQTSATPLSRPFGEEHFKRLDELARMYRALVDPLPLLERFAYDAGVLDVRAEYRRAYDHFLQRELLERAGMKREVAEAIIDRHPSTARVFADLIVEMASLANDGERLVEKKLPNQLGVLDVFGLLGAYPSVFFSSTAPSDRIERELAIHQVKQLSSPVVLGSAERQQKLNAQIHRMCSLFIDVYREVMEAAREVGMHCYRDARAMEKSIVTRAAFQNQPMPRLYKATLYGETIEAIDHFRRTGDRRIFRELIDKRAAASLRNVDGLFHLGEHRRLEDGGIELEKRTIDGITYSLRAHPNGDRTVRLSLPIGERGDHVVLSSLAGAPKLHRDQIVDPTGGPSPLRYHYSLDDWKSAREVGAKIEGNQLVFEIDVEPGDVGRLEGVFHSTARGDFWLHDATPYGEANYRGWVFASPDEQELERIAQSL